MKVLRSLLIAVAGGGLVLGGIVAADSPALSLRTVELVGGSTGKVDLEDVVSAGRLEKGANLLKLPTERAAQRIESLPWVADARVERILPSRIRVRIVEREPAYVAMSGSTPWLVASDGVVLEQADSGLVHLFDMPLPPLESGRKLNIAEFEHAVRIVATLPPALRGRLNHVRASSVERITLELVDGAAILYGAAEQMGDKNYAAQKLLEIYDSNGMSVETVDVRVPTRPAVRPQAERTESR